MTQPRNSTRRRHAVACLGAIAAVMAGAALAVWPLAARADVAPDKQGWWSELQTGPDATPVTAATGTNLAVGNDPSGVDALSAVEYNVPDSGGDPSSAGGKLTLKIAANSTVGTVAVTACRITGSWQPAQGGDWSNRPSYSCDGMPDGTVATDGSTVSFTLSSGQQSAAGVFSLAIVPSASAGSFQVQFTAPDASSFTVTGGDTNTPGFPPTASDTSTQPVPDSSSASTASMPISQTPLSVAPAEPLPVESAPPVTDASSAAPPAPAAAAPQTASTAPASSTASDLITPASSGRPAVRNTWARKFTAGFIAAALIVLWFLGGLANRTPRLQGATVDGGHGAPVTRRPSEITPLR